MKGGEGVETKYLSFAIVFLLGNTIILSRHFATSGIPSEFGATNLKGGNALEGSGVNR